MAVFKCNRKEVIKHLQRSVEMGFLSSRSLIMEPWWDAYREDPEFIAILADIGKKQSKQRNSLRAEGL